MSEHQCYEFQAIDRPLDAAGRAALRAISSRAPITATSFTNSYEWGDFKGDPTELMARWFDLHLHLTNWGTRRLMIRLPARLVDRKRLARLLRPVESVELQVAGENLILDICRDEVEAGEWDDGTGWLAALAPLRAKVLQGDLRLFHLLWLMGVEEDTVPAKAPEPGPGLGPMTASLEACADFFGLDPALVQAAAERPGAGAADAPAPEAIREAIAALSDQAKAGLLARLFGGDPHVAAELRAAVRERVKSPAGRTLLAPRTAGELRARAEAIRLARAQASAEQEEAERQRQAEAAEQARRARLDAIAEQGEAVWREIEASIGRRNPAGYDMAAALLSDLRVLAEERGSLPDFVDRLRTIRAQHARKERFIARLAGLG